MSLLKDTDDLPIKLNLDELKEELSKNGLVLCPVKGCDQDFKSLWGLKYHVRRANHQEVSSERKFKCEQCNQTFQSRIALREHRTLDHSGSESRSPLASPGIFNEMEGNATSSKGTIKRKRGRPKKNTDTSAKNNNSVTFDSTEMNKDASETLSPSVELPKKGENSDGTGRRTSTRVRTPRKNTFVYEEEDTTKNKRGNKRRKEDSEAGVSDNTPKKRGRKPKSSLVESRNSTRLKRLVKSGQSLACPNQGCRAKFTTALGYQSHVKICGIKEEEREKFPCEICGKQYMSYPGLTYHMKAKHTESEPINSDHSEVKDERSLKFYQVEEEEERQLQGRVVSKEQEDKWNEMLKTESDIVCPGVGCSETFKAVSSLKEHLQSCAKTISYKCLACGKKYLSLLIIQKHIKHLHVGYMPKGMEKSDSSDVDFQAASSGESEDDSDDVEIEEIDDSGSELNDHQEDAEEIVVWDDTRAKFKKPRKKRQPPNRTSGEDVRFGPIGAKDSESYTTTESWRKQEYTHKELFPNLRPSSSYWCKVELSEVDQYLPEATTSPPFQIRRKGESQCLEESTELPLFESTSKDHSSLHGDVTFNVGGPVWAMDWCPVPDSTKNSDQYLAISTHRSFDEVHNVHKCFSRKGLIQLWNVGQLKVNSASSGSKPTLSLGIAHDFGAIWDISWCPSISKDSKTGLLKTWPDYVSNKKTNGWRKGGLTVNKIFTVRNTEVFDWNFIGSYDRLYKVWDLKSPLMPVAVIKRGVPHEIHWPYGFANIMSCEDDAFQNLTYPCVARYFTFQTNKDERLTNLASTHNCTIWSISMSEWSNILACGDAAGEVVAVHVLPKKRKTFARFGIYRAFLEEIAGNSSSSEQNKEDFSQREQKNADSVEETQTDGSAGDNGSSADRKMKEILASKEKSSVNVSTSKSDADEMMETTNASGKTDGDAKKGTPTPPKTLGEVFEKHRLVFHDVNALEFKDRVDKSDPDFKRLLSPSTMQTIPYDQFANPQAIHKVRFNPNKQSYMWLASGCASGLARLHLVKQVTT
ncbi:hypothetical protein pdam_00017117 [Pocillopora damicornis]|uniref:C2H2-type domain-containing protein n=1 Tax=Pocillopora damicornis TaxID=46731 RepID=A0A3M6V3K6_POCDA|nr:hypothetical protein pdam_00017117 [Pocillopora damicornis]